MEKIAELLYNAYENYTIKNHVQEPEGYGETEMQFIKCLNTEQKHLFSKLETLALDYVRNGKLFLIQYILKLIAEDY